ncbi:unnamed protein product [Rotaria magnacalcarata]|uniref:Hint domain-containing protein n=1 Tax=Rotaria magnacalcarata TaxID=392030 RepID=A0A816G3E6_9BILA|nr:unnamed protein product [Rotaria magnacalcarata]CAF1669199.1 unnamed protein product [Rotaria magnacalcarata]CAF2042489.1 unnamed protein product [Rotaria magnacalcarata]CAF3987280.1 unnamed protein product [Rotaria magnacalcarata]CAF3993421.1 unnamed protein product [Rotaria magnacalcarata]
MYNHRVLYLTIILLCLFNVIASASTNCPVEVDPTTILSCVAIDAVGLVQATKGNIRGFCTMAERFMECLKTKTRGCIGEDFVRGSLSELIELSQKCCVNKDEKLTEECPFVAKPHCFSLTDMAKTPTDREIPIRDLKIGHKVLAIDHDDKIVTAEIISFLHYENEAQAFFYTFTTESGHRISITSDHLIFVGNRTYVQARFIDPKQHKLFVIGKNGTLQSSRILSIDVKLQRGYATPITQHGTLIVNNVSSSCYSSIHRHSLGHMAMAPIRFVHRAKQILGVPTKTDMNPNGIHWYPRTLNNLVHMLGPLANVFTTTGGKI